MPSSINWPEIMISTVITSILLPIAWKTVQLIYIWWRDTRPARQLLGAICRADEPCAIFVRDISLKEGTELFVNEPGKGPFIIPNINRVYADVEGKSIAYIYNVLGQVGKIRELDLIGYGDDVTRRWNTHLILIGAQAEKHFQFYKNMRKVAYRMDGDSLYRTSTDEKVVFDDGFGYGIILKAENPFKTGNYRGKGVAFLIGGFGTLGTLAASYYFHEHFRQLGEEFGSDSFGIVVRVNVAIGAEGVQRLGQFDVRFGRSTLLKRIGFWIGSHGWTRRGNGRNHVDAKSETRSESSRKVNADHVNDESAENILVPTYTPEVAATGTSAQYVELHPSSIREVNPDSESDKRMGQIEGTASQYPSARKAANESHSSGNEE